jgi:hypothetical protein
LIQSISLVADPLGDTIVNISPSSSIVGLSYDITIDINCVPGQPVKSYELTILFDPGVLQAQAVDEGTIFSGFSTFFNAGTINNGLGQITNVYGLIMGPGNVSNPGSLVSINFSTVGTGVSSIQLTDVGITNETQYVPLSVVNGSVTVDGTPPEITDSSSSSGTTGDAYTFLVSVTDDVTSGANMTVMVDWSHGSLGENVSMSYGGGSSFSTSIVLDANSLGNLTYSVYGFDQCGNHNTTQLASVSVFDNDKPSVSGVGATPVLQEINNMVNISGTIADNIGVGDVRINISYPDSSWSNFTIIANVSGSDYYSNKIYSQVGVYDYILWAQDANGNQQMSSVNQFSIIDTLIPEFSSVTHISSNPLDTDTSFGWVNVSSVVTDNGGVSDVYLNVTNPDSSWSNISLISFINDIFYRNSSTLFSSIGNYSYQIDALDSNGNWNSSSIQLFSMPPNWDIDANGVIQVLDLVLVSNQYGETGSFGWIREDVDNNGEVQILDLVLVSNHYTESWWI